MFDFDDYAPQTLNINLGFKCYNGDRNNPKPIAMSEDMAGAVLLECDCVGWGLGQLDADEIEQAVIGESAISMEAKDGEYQVTIKLNVPQDGDCETVENVVFEQIILKWGTEIAKRNMQAAGEAFWIELNENSFRSMWTNMI